MIDLQRILAAYPRHLADARWVALGNAGGFSGSRIWRGTTFAGQEFALKQYSSATTGQQLERVHGWMNAAREKGLTFVPAVQMARDGRTIATVEKCCWDISTWMPGKADFHENPTDSKLFAAVQAIARLHTAWENLAPPSQRICPAILRRSQALQDARILIENGPPPRVDLSSPIKWSLERARALLPLLLPRMEAALAPWRNRLVSVQPCIGDVWHDHVLFRGESISGIIDFAAAKLDAAESDLARLLGSLIPGERERMRRALNAYQDVRPLLDYQLVEVLDVTGTFGAVVNWLMRFRRLPPEELTRAGKRFGRLVTRLNEIE